MVNLGLFTCALAAATPAWARPEPPAAARRETHPVVYMLTRMPHNELEKRGSTHGPAVVTDVGGGKTYAIPLEVGTPPQTIMAILKVDFSDIQILPGCEEHNCSEIVPNTSQPGDFPAYSPAASSTFKDLSQEVRGSWYQTEGVLFTDTVSLGAGGSRENERMINSSAPFSKLSTSYKSAAVLGLGFPKPDRLPPPREGVTQLEYSMQGDNRPLWKYLADEVWAEPQFGLYLQELFLAYDIWWNMVPNAGQIMFGGLNKNMYTGEVNYIAAVGQDWRIPLEGIKVGGQAVDMAANGTAGPLNMELDTRIWLLTVPPEIMVRLQATVPGANTLTTFMVPCDTTTTISFTFGGQDYAMEPHHWLAQIGEDRCLSCIVVSIEPYYRLSTPFLQTVYTAFRATPLSVGFAKLHPMAADYIQINETYSQKEDDKAAAAAKGGVSGSPGRPVLTPMVMLVSLAAVAVTALL